MKRRYEVLIILFIIVLAIPLARGRGLTETNFSVLGNRGSRRICFLLWAALVGSYLYLYIEETAELAKRRQDAGMADQAWRWQYFCVELVCPIARDWFPLWRVSTYICPWAEPFYICSASGVSLFCWNDNTGQGFA